MKAVAKCVVAATTLMFGAVGASADESTIDTLYVEAMECRVAAKAVHGLPQADEPSEAAVALLAQMAEAEAAYAASTRWLGSRTGKDALRVKAEFAIAMLSVARKMLEGETATMEYAKDAAACAEVIQEAQA